VSAVAVELRRQALEIRGELERERLGITLAEDAARLSGDLSAFVRQAWPWVVPNPLVPGWHIDAICDHLQAAYQREIRRLVITVPPGTGKSTLVSVIAPAWRWANEPGDRLLTSSWKDEYATRDTRRGRALIQSAWYQQRFTGFALTKDENTTTRYSNDRRGYRVAGHVGGGTGERGDVLILDDPHNAQEMHSDAMLASTREWWGDTWASRLNDSTTQPGVMIVIGQRIHQDDLIGMLLRDGRWTHLCLPARYEPSHMFVTPPEVSLANGRVLRGDPRVEDGDLLAPGVLSAERLDELAADMTAHVAAGQLQQRPAPKEGALLRRADWRFYDPSLSFYRRDGRFALEQAASLAAVARFTRIVHSWDTSLKDGAKNDYVAGQVWGVSGANRYLLRLFKQRAGLNATIEAMDHLAAWALAIWPRLPHTILIEAAATGPDAAAEIKQRVDGVTLVSAKGAKELRAAAAAPALEGHNCFLPGYQSDDLAGYDARTPAAVQEFVESAAVFPNGAHDDDVDAWSQMVNWTRAHGKPARVSFPQGRVPEPGALAGLNQW
jgi:predicted phage terminase large subunit-like protein